MQEQFTNERQRVNNAVRKDYLCCFLLLFFPLNALPAQGQDERKQMSEVECELRKLQSSLCSIHIPANASLILSSFFFSDVVP